MVVSCIVWRGGGELKCNTFTSIEKQVPIHVERASKSDCSDWVSKRQLICLNNLVSSANSRTVEKEVEVGRSLIYVRNSKGPRILPCGTPERTGSLDDTWEFIETQ